MILHIFRKDVRRLWAAILASLAVLASLAWQDRWRSDWMPGEAESYLNLLVPLVWALLIGLAVEQEPLAGDRQFWLTRPYRRGDLLAAKLLFAGVFVHAPSFLADCYILTARGFSPLSYAPELLVKQALLAGALTLPGIALASLVRAFSHFVLELVAVAAAVLLLSGTFGGGLPILARWEPFQSVRSQTLVVCAAAGAALIVGLQYLIRRVAWSRALAGISAAASLALFLLFVPRTALAIRTITRPAAAAPAIQLDPEPRPKERTASRDVVVNLPIVISGVPDGEYAQVEAVRTQISAAGRQWIEDMPTKYRPFDRRPFQVWAGRTGWNEHFPLSLSFQIDPKVFAAIQISPTTIQGEAAVTLIRPGPSVWMSIGESAYIAGIGRCYTSIVEDRFAQRIKLECESPRGQVGGVRARLWSPRSGREWINRLGGARTTTGTPRIVWLSPLNRDVVFWDIVPDPPHPTDHWRVPASEAGSTRVEITPHEVVGYAAVRYEFSGLDLRRYRTEPLSPVTVR